MKPKMQLQGGNGSHDGETETHAGVDMGSSTSHNRGSSASGGGEVASANRGNGDNSSVLGNTVGRLGLDGLIARLGGLLSRRLSRLLLSRRGSKGNLGNSVLSADNASGAATRDGSALSHARLSDSRVDNDGGDISSGHGRRRDGDDLGDGLSTSGNARVLLDIRSADTLEEADGIGNSLVVLAKGVQAVEDVLNELLALAEAGRVCVALALLDNVQPGVEALGDLSRARQRLGGDDDSRSSFNGLVSGGGRDNGLAFILSLRLALSLDFSVGLGLRGARNLGRLGLLAGHDNLGAGLSLSDRADGSADRNSDSDDVGATGGLDRALGDGRLAAGDGLNRRSEDGRGGLVRGDNNAGGLDSGAWGSALCRSRLSRLGALAGSRDDNLSSGLLGRSGGSLLGRDSRGSLLSGNGSGGLLGRRSGLLHGRGLDEGGGSNGLGLAVELDLVDLDLAKLLEQLRLLLGENDADLLGATALGVDNGGTLAGAGAGVLAARAVRHSVVEVEASVNFGSDRVAVDGEGSNVVAGRDGRVVVLVISTAVTDNGLATKGASSQRVIAAVELILTGPAFEVASAVVADLTDRNRDPIVARDLILLADDGSLAGAFVAADALPVLEAATDDTKLDHVSLPTPAEFFTGCWPVQ